MKKLLKKLVSKKIKQKLKELIIPIIILIMMIIIIIISAYKIINKDLDGSKINDKNKPQCIISERDKKENDKIWTNINQTISIDCIDSNTGCKQKTYTKTFTTSTKTGIITIEDNSKNKTNCEVSVNLDNDEPTCNIVVDGTKGDNGWYKEKNVKIHLTMNDPTTEVVEYGLTTEKVQTYNFQKEAIQTDTSSTTWYGYVKDAAGNMSMCQKTIKLDTQKPTCNITSTGTKGNNDWYITPVTISIATSDNGPSTISSFGLSDTEKIKFDNNTTKIQKEDAINKVWFGKVKDIAGNENTCHSELINVDVTKPKITFNTKEGTYKSNEPLLITSACLDETSGVISTKTETILLSPSINNKIIHSCIDLAGNKSETTGTFNVKTYSRNISCGVEKYNICTDPLCGEKKDEKGNKIYESCRNKQCGVELYKECWHY